jgi:hypothetical protein
MERPGAQCHLSISARLVTYMEIQKAQVDKLLQKEKSIFAR